MGLELNALGVLNPDGCSYSFDERAAGYGRSEGVGAVVLKRMSDALRDGDSELHPLPRDRTSAPINKKLISPALV